jgi:hypothetical protein
VRRFLLVLGAAAVATAAFAGVAQATGAFAGVARATGGSSCAGPADAGYQHSFDGAAGTVTITAARALCEGAEQSFSLVSYTGSGASQFVYDTDNAWIDSRRRSVTLGVDVPGCAMRVQAVIGTGIVNRPGSSTGLEGHSDGELATYTGGAEECAPRPSVAFESYCDGVLHTRLANAADASVDAVFVVDGKRIRVRPGKRADLTSHPSGVVEVLDSTGAVSVGSWISPVDCAPPESTSSSEGASS